MDQRTRDGRLNVRHGDMAYPLPTYATREAWEARAADLRRRILVSTGLWPWPEKRPLRPQVTGRCERAGYTIENVYLESWPGFYVTGNLYCPLGQDGPFPGVLSPHGHWEHGRLEHQELSSVPARCINLARQGYVVLAYDMIGYNDSRLQVPLAGHGRASPSVFRNPRATLWGISLMGLQLWNSIRALDYLCSLPDVDPSRLACTGSSGGGTQTFMLAAVDQRVKVAAPVNMISAHFQGGCLCENAPNLRLEATNVEIAALMAPRPLLMVSATGDWTANTPQVEFPWVQGIYRLYGAAERVANVHVDADHNYNRESREAVYAWFGRWLHGAVDAPQLREQPIELEAPERMLVFPASRLPAGAVTCPQLLQDLIAAAGGQIESLRPTGSAGLQAYRELLGTAYRAAISAGQPEAGDLVVERGVAQVDANCSVERLVVGRKGSGERTPGLLFLPPNPRGAVLVVHPEGQGALVAAGVPSPLVQGLLAHGLMVLGIDTFGTGELALVGRDESDPHFLTYNRTDTALRVQDILNGLAYLQTRTHTVHLVGLGPAGLWCLLARGLATSVATTVVDAAQFPYHDDGAWAGLLFIPQLRRAGGLLTAAALATPDALVIHNAAPTFPTAWYHQVYAAAGAPQALRIQPEGLAIDGIIRCLASALPPPDQGHG